MEVVASLSQGRTAAAQCGLFTHKPAPVIFGPPCTCNIFRYSLQHGALLITDLKCCARDSCKCDLFAF